MNGLITLRRDAVLTPDPEPSQPIDVEPLPFVDEDGEPTDWSYRQARGLRFARWRAEHGAFEGDRFGLPPEPLPPIVRKVEP